MPSFAIEVPGEANPLTEQQLVQTLTSAASSDPNQIKSGAAQLQQWEKSPGYYKGLQSVYLDQRLPFEIRYLSIIQLKNGIDKYWRRTATNAVSKEDKDSIRSRLLEGAINEADHRLAAQNALVIAKIARHEYPKDWPDVLSSLTTTLRSHLPPLQLARALLVLLQIVKELSTGRLQGKRQNLQGATPEIVHVLGRLYSSSVDSWRESVATDGAAESLDVSLMTMKVLRRLLISGYEHPNRDNEVIGIWSLAQEHLGAFVLLQKQTERTASLKIQKLMVQLSKLQLDMVRDHPAAFAMLPNSVDLARAYWSLAKDYAEGLSSKETQPFEVSRGTHRTENGVSDGKGNMEKMALNGLLIIRACLKMVHNPTQTFKYRTPEDKNEKNQATNVICQDLLTQDLIQDIMENLVAHYFIFRQEDLNEWEEEPEEWEKREEGDGEDWEFSIRSCSEKLFLDLAIFYKDVLVQPLLRVFYSVATPRDERVLFKDSVYTAIGLAAPVVHEFLDFDAFIRDVLVTEVQKQTPGFNVIRRRAAILLGQWITVKISPDSRSTVYEIFQHLLNREDPLNDQVVRITAGRQFKNICDAWEFDSKQFLPYAAAILTRLMQLIEEVELTETKMALLNTISVAVERLDHYVSPFAERIVSMLPPLWEASGDEHLMKQAILTILARLVTAMKADSLPIHAMVFPIIRGAVAPGSETQVYLLDDAMDLWASILVQTTEPASEELLALVPYLFPIYELGSENLRKALEITESYVLLAPAHMLSDSQRLPLLTALSSLLGALRPDANGLVCSLVEVIIRTAEKLGGENAVSQAAGDLAKAGFLPTLLEGLRGSWAANNTTGPLKKSTPIDDLVESDYYCVLARLALGSVRVFCEACHHAGSADAGGPSLESTMQWLLEEWFKHFDNIGDPARRKLMSLALAGLLTTNTPWILNNLQGLFSMWTDVIIELREQTADITEGGNVGTMSDSLLMSDPGPPVYEDVTVPEVAEEVRRRHLVYSDPIHAVNLPEFIKARLQGAIAACGGEQTFQQEWLINVDTSVLEGFSKLGIMG